MRQRLLKAAARELVRGRGRLELATVAQRLGVSQGLSYRYFTSKDVLIASVVDEFFDAFDAAVFLPDFAEQGDWPARERERTHQFVQFMYDRPIAPFVFARLVGERQAIGVQQARLERQIAMAAVNIRRGQGEGAIPTDMDPDLCGALVVGGLVQAMLTALVMRPRPLQEQLSGKLFAFVAAVLRISE